MADHKAEQILLAVTANLTGLTTTLTNVYRAREYPFEDHELPGLAVYMGPDTPITDIDQNVAFIDYLLEVVVEIHAKTPSEVLDTVLNQIKKEVTIALRTDRTQGLAFVIDTLEAGFEQPILDNDGNQPTATTVGTFGLKYRRSLIDPSL